MRILQATFGELFGAAFAVGLAFDAALFVLGLLAAIIQPGFFHSGVTPGTQVAASSPAQAIGVLVLMMLFAVIANLLVSSGGAGLTVLGRFLKILPKGAKA
ncbi:MAG TPA: hypothetical protein VJS38_17435 [Phenylobacterium sp.]|uniref:hypothetical protein n=1 Tax=Phenylobacterium sp. TaxID=1871053 RepID=UPI002B483238|nr:hypothetical protein [Phenylobacterium sp.]HKR89956.1 hypothetical protein [Phenylobacterium sp.]